MRTGKLSTTVCQERLKCNILRQKFDFEMRIPYIAVVKNLQNNFQFFRIISYSILNLNNLPQNPTPKNGKKKFPT